MNQAAPSRYVDFDGDGRRDIAYWQPPSTLTGTGHFTVLLSTHGSRDGTADKLEVDFGTLGSMPVLADY